MRACGWRSHRDVAVLFMATPDCWFTPSGVLFTRAGRELHGGQRENSPLVYFSENLSPKCKIYQRLRFKIWVNGGPSGIRTQDRRIKSPLVYTASRPPWLPCARI